MTSNGKSRSDNERRVTIIMPPELFTRIESAAQEMDRSVSWWMRAAALLALDEPAPKPGRRIVTRGHGI